MKIKLSDRDRGILENLPVFHQEPKRQSRIETLKDIFEEVEEALF